MFIWISSTGGNVRLAIEPRSTDCWSFSLFPEQKVTSSNDTLPWMQCCEQPRVLPPPPSPTPVERGTVRVRFLVKEHNTMALLTGLLTEPLNLQLRTLNIRLYISHKSLLWIWFNIYIYIRNGGDAVKIFDIHLVKCSMLLNVKMW